MNTLRGALRSWTMWFNGVMGSVALAVPLLLQYFPDMQAYVPDKWYHWIMGTLTFGNVLLRMKTSMPLADKVAPKETTQ